jgi:predicted metalloendopeptidase
VNLIAHKSAYGTTSPDLRSPTSIKEYSEGAAVNKTSFYGSATILNQVAADKLWKTANQKLDKGAWLMPAQTVNALYEANRNQVMHLSKNFFTYIFL